MPTAATPPYKTPVKRQLDLADCYLLVTKNTPPNWQVTWHGEVVGRSTGSWDVRVSADQRSLLHRRIWQLLQRLVDGSSWSGRYYSKLPPVRKHYAAR